MPEQFVSPEDVIRHSAREDGVTPEKKGYNQGRPLAKRSTAYQMQVWERRAKMAAMCADGMTMEAIAKEFGVTGAYVGQQIREVVEDLHRRSLETLQLKIAREVAVLNMVQLEATLAWFESKQGKVTNVKRRKKEIRSSFAKKGLSVHTVKEQPLPEVARKTRSRFAAMFADGPVPDVEDLQANPAPNPNIPLDREQAQSIVQMPIETEEEYERTEESSGAPEFLRVILDCHEKRAKLLGLYKGTEEEGYEAVANLTPEQRVARLAALAQDIRAAKAIVDADSTRQGLPAQNANPIPAKPAPANVWTSPGQSAHNGNGEAQD